MIRILAFGQVAAVIGSSMDLHEAISDTDGLNNILKNKFPELVSIQYALAIDKKMVHENVLLTDDVTVALLPPFSGG